LGRIPYDPVVTEAMVNGLPVTDYRDGELSNVLKKLWLSTKEKLFASEAIPV
jgi:hypothetical protein